MCSDVMSSDVMMSWCHDVMSSDVMTHDAGAGGWAEQEHELLAADELHRHRRHTPQQLPAALHHGSVHIDSFMCVDILSLV